jgi:hypothetical protein
MEIIDREAIGHPRPQLHVTNCCSCDSVAICPLCGRSLAFFMHGALIYVLSLGLIHSMLPDRRETKYYFCILVQVEVCICYKLTSNSTL